MRKLELRTDGFMALTGLSVSTTRNWDEIGLIKARREGDGKKAQGRAVLFDLLAVFVACLCRTLAKRHMPLAFILPIAEFLNTLTIEEIQEAAESQKVLVAAGALMRPQFMDFDEATFKQIAAKARESGTSEMLLTLPMAGAWERFAAGLDHYDRYLAVPSN